MNDKSVGAPVGAGHGLARVAGTVVRHFPWFIAAYFAVQVVRRLLEPHELGIDEAEQIIMGQVFSWGYGSQPPFYTWLQIPLFMVFGRTILALALLKGVILFLTFYFFFRAAEITLGDRAKAVAATLTLFLIPQVGWESQRALTHSAMVTCAAAATFYVFLELMANRRRRDFVLFGIAVGFGVLSKYNYPIFVVGLLLAALFTPRGRAAVFDLRMFAISLPLSAVIVLPTGLWSLFNLDLLLSRTHKFAIEADRGLLSAWALGVPKLTLVAVAFCAVCVPIYLLVAYLPLEKRDGAAKAEPMRWTDARRLAVLTPIACLAVLLVFVLATGATSIQDRWLQPYLFIVPLSLYVLLDSRLGPRRQAILGAIGAFLATVAVVVLFVYARSPDLWNHPSRAVTPFGVIARDIRAGGFTNGTVVSYWSHLAGGLAFHLPEAHVMAREYTRLPIDFRPPLLFVWIEDLSANVRDVFDRVSKEICSAPLPEELDVKTYSYNLIGATRRRVVLHTAIVSCPK